LLALNPPTRFLERQPDATLGRNSQTRGVRLAGLDELLVPEEGQRSHRLDRMPRLRWREDRTVGGAVEAAPALPLRELARHFWPFARPYRRYLILIIVLIWVVTVITGAQLYMIKVTVDEVLVPGELDALLWIAPAVMGLTVLGGGGRSSSPIGAPRLARPLLLRGSTPTIPPAHTVVGEHPISRATWHLAPRAQSEPAPTVCHVRPSFGVSSRGDRRSRRMPDVANSRFAAWRSSGR
jgi:hypothetical protein